MIFILRCEKCDHLNGNVNGEVVRSNVVCDCKCHEIPRDGYTLNIQWCKCEHASLINGVCVVCNLPRIIV